MIGGQAPSLGRQVGFCCPTMLQDTCTKIVLPSHASIYLHYTCSTTHGMTYIRHEAGGLVEETSGTCGSRPPIE